VCGAVFAVGAARLHPLKAALVRQPMNDGGEVTRRGVGGAASGFVFAEGLIDQGLRVGFGEELVTASGYPTR